jgi:hypothetical protein
VARLDNLDLERLEDLANHPGFALVTAQLQQAVEQETSRLLTAPTWEDVLKARGAREAYLTALQMRQKMADGIRAKRRT